MVSLGQELEKGLARQFWFNVSWVNAVTQAGDGWSWNSKSMEHLGTNQTSISFPIISEHFHVASVDGIVWASSQLCSLRAVRLFTQ